MDAIFLVILWPFHHYQYILIKFAIGIDSVADPGCLSRIRILIFTHPGSRISDPGSKNRNKRERWKKICYHTFFCSHKIEYYVIFKMLKKKIWANFQWIVEVFIQKIFNMLSNIWIWDPEKTYSGSRIQGSKRHRIPDPDPQHWASTITTDG